MPVATPVTIPVVLPTMAFAVLLLDHVPPGVALLSVMVAPGQTDDAPVVAESGFMVTVVVVIQPLLIKYVIVAVPADTPVTTPVVPTDATLVLLLLQVPPDVALDSVVVVPAQIEVVPVIAVGDPMVIVVVVTQPVPVK